MEQPPVVVFCDFDGTITTRDVGYWLFHHFSNGRNVDLIPDWKSGAMSSREVLTAEAALVTASSEDIFAFLDTFELDPGFVAFDRFCQKNNIPLVILSDGLDFYIEHIFARHNLTHLPITANAGFVENNGIRIEYPHTNSSCRRCGSCKKERMREYMENQAKGIRTVFIGDGYSDICAAREVDLLFAKKDLEEYCLAENISYNSYGSFFDIAEKLTQLGYL